MDQARQGSDVLFILLGAIMVLAMHAGFAFLELGTVRTKNQVNALVKILTDFSVSTVAYFFVGYTIAYGVQFFSGAEQLAQQGGYALVKFFFLLTFAAAIPAIVSGGIAERARFGPQLAATALLVGIVYPLFEGIAWGQRFGLQGWLEAATVPPSTTSPAASWCTPSAAGSASRRCCCSARAATATARTARPMRTRRRRSPSSRSAPGCSPSAGSAST